MEEIILDPIQEEAKQRLLKNFRYCLFWDVGVGKTYPVLARLKMFTDRKKILILAPAVSIKNMWTPLMAKDAFGVFSQHDVELRGFEWLAWRRIEYKVSERGVVRKVITDHLRELRHQRYDVIIIDEAHRLSTSGKHSSTSRITSKLVSNATYTYGLTGTPARNGYHELYHLFKNLNIAVWGDLTYPEFLTTYFKGFTLNLPQGPIFKPTGFKAYTEEPFRAKISPYCMFAEKDRPYDVEYIDIELKSHKLPEYYKALKGIYTDITGAEQVTMPMVSFLKAYMILNGFQYQMRDDGANIPLVYFKNPKLEKVVDIINNEFNSGTKAVVVFYNFQHDFTEIIQELNTNNIIYTTDIAEAHTKPGNFVILLQLKRGISINLQDVSNVVIFYTYNFSYVDYDQCIGRVDRRGQEKDVRIYRLVFYDSIEKKIILKALLEKRTVDRTLKSTVGGKLLEREIKEYGH